LHHFIVLLYIQQKNATTFHGSSAKLKERTDDKLVQVFFDGIGLIELTYTRGILNMLSCSNSQHSTENDECPDRNYAQSPLMNSHCSPQARYMYITLASNLLGGAKIR
jgi:hypothetical protein